MGFLRRPAEQHSGLCGPRLLYDHHYGCEEASLLTRDAGTWKEAELENSSGRPANPLVQLSTFSSNNINTSADAGGVLKEDCIVKFAVPLERSHLKIALGVEAQHAPRLLITCDFKISGVRR